MDKPLPMHWTHTLVVGSGAAGLNAAVRLREEGIADVTILTEGLQHGTSINTGSDKQTYYKLSLCGGEGDSPRMMAETFFSGGAMHGDIALAEAALSARAFTHLVDLGVPFPQDAFGQFIGYKTDHDPRSRATSIGPYTSREMCRALIRRVEELDIPVIENRNAVELLTIPDGDLRRAVGVIAVDPDGQLEVHAAENIVLAVGGPGGLYQTSVYPEVHNGAIGLALAAGAAAQNLPESQYGMASIKFRWNVSGTFMQVVPRFISTDADGVSGEREFLSEYFDSPAEMHSNIFLKGYQWPFDSRLAIGGSSIIDILVYVETVARGRRVWLDFRSNPDGYARDALSEEARGYLENSGATQATPIERLQQMNPAAIELYADHGIDITTEPLEIAVCAQHNNGGLSVNHWWESTSIRRLFPIGEVSGTHGAYRPGGSALNSGQVGGFRAAALISAKYADDSVDRDAVKARALDCATGLASWLSKGATATKGWNEHRRELQQRMTRAGAHVRSVEVLEEAVGQAREQLEQLEQAGCGFHDTRGCVESLRNRHLCLAHLVYLDAVLSAVKEGVGSRGSAMVLAPEGQQVHPQLDDSWRLVPENTIFRESVQITAFDPATGKVANSWESRRPIPETDTWFETAWASFRKGEIYD